MADFKLRFNGRQAHLNKNGNIQKHEHVLHLESPKKHRVELKPIDSNIFR